ncbi:MAG: hypothetical protein WC773_02230 [Patescibacteria group bacterium]|jgi:ribulose-phosphate 3-epimerase
MEIIPSILARNLEEVRNQVDLVKLVANVVHLDVCDGTLVPGATPSVSDQLNIVQHNICDVHLMVMDPARYLDGIKAEKVRYIYAHPKAATFGVFLEQTKILNLKAGVALSPEDPVELIRPYLDSISSVLILTVSPGESGRPFQEDMIGKITEVKNINSDLFVAVDGGIEQSKFELIGHADAAVIHSAIFNKPNPEESLLSLQGQSN